MKQFDPIVLTLCVAFLWMILSAGPMRCAITDCTTYEWIPERGKALEGLMLAILAALVAMRKDK